MTELTDVFEHRRADFTLDEAQEQRDGRLRSFLADAVTVPGLRELGEVSFDGSLLPRLVEAGHLPSPGATLSWSVPDLVVAAEALGAALAPAPAVEYLVAGRLVERLARMAMADRGSIPQMDVTGLVTVALRPLDQRQLIPAGAVSETIIGYGDAGLFTAPAPLRQAPNRAGAPFGWLEPPDRLPVALVADPAARRLFDQAVAEWQVLTSALSVGLARTALGFGIEFARNRTTHGTPIGALQGISHPLAEAHAAIESARDVVRKAAWYLEHEPRSRPEFVLMALVAADESSNLATRVSVHVQGGYGVSLDSDVTLTVTRAKAWLRPAGRVDDWLVQIGRLVAARTVRSAPMVSSSKGAV